MESDILTQESIGAINLYNNMFLSKVQGKYKFTPSEKNVYFNLAAYLSQRSRYMRDGYSRTAKILKGMENESKGSKG